MGHAIRIEFSDTEQLVNHYTYSTIKDYIVIYEH